MKKFLILFFFVSATEVSLAQNLLVNGDFEDENICTEYHVNCSPEGWISTSDAFNNFFKTPGLAHSGQHCVAIEAGHSKKQFRRTYIRTQLLCRLRSGNKYEIQFYVKSRHNILDSIGVYFTPYDFLFERQTLYRIVPSLFIVDAANGFQKGDTGWQKISFDYTATGKELYLTLGNFSKRDISGPTNIPLVNDFLVFFDDITMVAQDPNEKLCEDWRSTKEEIYNFDARHQLLDIYVKRYINNPPDVPDIGKTIIETIDTLTLPDIFFEVNKATLSKRSVEVLDSLSARLYNRRIDSLVIEGHTDSTGTIEYNQRLSTDRALSVARYLEQRLSFFKPLITSRGMGSTKPKANNETLAGRQLNRRVEIFIYIRQ